MSSLSPTASGILMGSISGAAMGALAGAPAGGVGAVPGAIIGAVAGAATGYLGAEEARKKQRAAQQAITDQKAAGIQNENALVAEAYNKRKSAAQGLGQVPGNIASQTGAVLTSPTGESQNSIY
jgi:phage tail tape-measure protein